jgi:hypothetical protein
MAQLFLTAEVVHSATNGPPVEGTSMVTGRSTSSATYNGAADASGHSGCGAANDSACCTSNGAAHHPADGATERLSVSPRRKPPVRHVYCAAIAGTRRRRTWQRRKGSSENGRRDERTAQTLLCQLHFVDSIYRKAERLFSPSWLRFTLTLAYAAGRAFPPCSVCHITNVPSGPRPFPVCVCALSPAKNPLAKLSNLLTQMLNTASDVLRYAVRTLSQRVLEEFAYTLFIRLAAN